MSVKKERKERKENRLLTSAGGGRRVLYFFGHVRTVAKRGERRVSPSAIYRAGCIVLA